jgi:hypothetical protein
MEGRHGSCDRGLAQFEILATSILSSCLLPRTISRFRSHPSIRTFQCYQNGAYELMNFKEGITSLASTSCGDPHFQQNSLSCLEILIARGTIKLVHALENIHGINPSHFVVFWTESCQFSSFAYVSNFVREHITCV